MSKNSHKKKKNSIPLSQQEKRLDERWDDFIDHRKYWLKMLQDICGNSFGPISSKKK
jgi:hypothetical protein